MKRKIMNIGSLNYDYVYQVEHFLKPGETQSSLKMAVNFGGKGLNQSIALARAGAILENNMPGTSFVVYHAGGVGEDGEEILSFLRRHGVDTNYVQRMDGKTGHAIIQVEQSGENCILLYGGTNQKMTEEYLNHVLKNLKKGDYLILQNEVNKLDYIIEKAYEKELYTILNPSPYNQKVAVCDLNKVSLILINEVEGREITGAKEPDQILSSLKERYPRLNVVLTLGEKGVMYFDGQKVWKQDALVVDVVDTTAAGDTFTGYFIGGMLEGLTVEENLERSTNASALAIAKAGAAVSIPTRAEVLKS